MSKLTNQVVIVLVPYHNKLWVLYLDCTRGYLQFDMLVAIVSVRNNETCIFRTRSADDYGTGTKRHFSHLLPGYKMSTMILCLPNSHLLNI